MLLGELNFMAAWCATLKMLFKDTNSEVKVWRWGPNYDPVIQFSIQCPSCYLKSYFSTSASMLQERTANTQKLLQLREGLALFAAIASIDAEIVVQLLEEFVCHPEQIYRDDVSEMDELPAMIELNLSKLALDLDSINNSLVLVCSQLDQQNTSNDFKEAWKQIEALSSVSINLKIPVRLVVNEEHSEMCALILARTLEVVREILDKNQVNWGWASYRPESTSTRLSPGFYSSFILNSISLNQIETELGNQSVSLSEPFLETIHDMCGHVHFSKFEFCLPIQRPTRQEAAALCKMLSSLLSEVNHPPNSQPDLRFGNTVNLKFNYFVKWQIEAFCAALAVTQTCKSVHIFSATYCTPPDTWQWLAYALFSKRARTRSSVRKIKLSRVLLSAQDAEAMAKILESASPEQELFNTKWEDTSVVVANDEEFQVKGDATVKFHDGGKWVHLKSQEVCRQGGVKLIGDDKESKWVDVMIPGVGFCVVQRSSLVPFKPEPVNTEEKFSEISLEIEIIYKADNGLSRLLKFVGTSLRCLRVTFHNEDYYMKALDMSWIISSSPQLLELTIKNRRIAAESFLLACERNNCRLYKLQVYFNDFRVVADTLKDKFHPLTKHLRWWYCYNYIDSTRSLREMLDVNRSITCFTVETFKNSMEKFNLRLMKYHQQELETQGQKVRRECKAAFLSIFSLISTHFLPKKQAPGARILRLPDVHVMAIIFNFASERAVRNIKIVRG